MSKIKIEVCEICKSQKCDGVIFETEDMWGSYGFHVGIKRICSSDEDLDRKKLLYRLTSGHGDYTLYKVKKISSKN